jgi:RNA polymerase sigma-70 factor (ECF subfamily)
MDIVHASDVSTNADSISQLSEQEIMEAVQQLPPAYRMVFNLYAIEGYKHDEIAHKLGISAGTSKSNLAKARMKLKKVLEETHTNNYNKKHG